MFGWLRSMVGRSASVLYVVSRFRRSCFLCYQTKLPASRNRFDDVQSSVRVRSTTSELARIVQSHSEIRIFPRTLALALFKILDIATQFVKAFEMLKCLRRPFVHQKGTHMISSPMAMGPWLPIFSFLSDGRVAVRLHHCCLLA